LLGTGWAPKARHLIDIAGEGLQSSGKGTLCRLHQLRDVPVVSNSETLDTVDCPLLVFAALLQGMAGN
jgi:hypothetical protein